MAAGRTCFLAAIVALLPAAGASHEARHPFRGTRVFLLPSGCHDEEARGIDSVVGTIVCDGGALRIRYDIGDMAGNVCASDPARPYENLKGLQLGAREGSLPGVAVCSTPADGPFDLDELAAHVYEQAANFRAAVASPAHVQAFLAVVLSFRSPEPPEPLSALTERLQGDGALAAARELRQRRDPRALPALRRALGHPDPMVRAMVMRAIGALGPVARAAVPEMLGSVAGVPSSAETEVVVSQGIRAVQDIGLAARPAVVAALDSENPCRALLAAELLTRDGRDIDSLVPALIRAAAREREPLSCSSPGGVELHVADAVSRLGSRVVPRLVALLRSSPGEGCAGHWGPEGQAHVVASVMTALGPAARPRLEALREDEDRCVRAVAQESLEDLSER